MTGKKLSILLFPVIPFLLVAGLLEAGSSSGFIPPYLFPAPSAVWGSFLEDAVLYRTAFLQTFLASALGLGLSVICGLSIALLFSLSSVIRKMFYPYAIFFQTVPIIAVAPLLVIWFGYGMPTVVAAAFIVSIFPMIANSALGLMSVNDELMDLFRLLDASPMQVLFRLRLPHAIPQILGGLKISAGLAVIGAIVGEFISGSGLGGLIDVARNQQRLDRVFAAICLAAALGIAFFALISAVNALILKANHQGEST